MAIQLVNLLGQLGLGVGQKAAIARPAVAQAASVALQVMLCVLTGEVVSKVAALWERLICRLTATDVATDRQNAAVALSPIKKRQPDEGMSP